MRRKIYIQIFLVILILFISFTVYQKYFKISPSLDTEVINKETTNQGNTLVNITYESIDNLGRKYIITAESGTFDENEPDLIFMLNVIANIYLEDNTVIYIKSSKAEYNSLNYDTKFQENIEVNFLNHNFFCNNLNIFFKDNLLEAFNDLIYKNLDIIMSADKIEVNLLTKNSKIFNFEDNKVKIKKRNSNGNN
tara:strand:- start:111 stop:692 length:582 start_codon:yes stop_codon:yes gene_type:complete